MTEVQAILFDMDGLIIDTERVYREGWRVGAKAAGEELPESFLKQTAGKSSKQTVAQLEKIVSDVTKIPLIRQIREAYFVEELQANRIPLKPYFLESIHYLKTQHYVTALVTSTASQRTSQIFEKYQLAAYFDEVVTGDLVQEAKPNPAIYQLALKKLQIEPHQSLVFEDSLVGARAAEAAGIPLVLIPEKNTGGVTQSTDWQNVLHEAADFQAAMQWLWQTKMIR